MADSKLSALTASGALGGTELFYSDNGTADVKVTATQIKTFSVGAGSVSVASGKTLTASNSLTLAGADSTTMTFPSSSTTLAGLSIANSFTTSQNVTPSSDVISLALRRNGGSQTSNILEIQTEANAFLAGFDKSGILTAPGVTVSGGPLTLSGNQSAASWGLNGIKLIGGGSTLTDTSAAGTVASGATDVFGGNTIAATNARTLTDYYSLYIKQPVAGTNVTFTNKWSLGLDGRLRVGGTTLFGDYTVSGNGYYLTTNQSQGFYSGGSTVWITAGSSGYLAVNTNGSIGISANNDTFLSRAAAATLQLGAADAAAPVAQTFQVQSVVAGTSNTAGANWTIAGSKGTGTGAGGSIIFQVAPAGTTGTSQNALATALTIDATKVITVADTYGLAFSGTTGSKIGTATTQKIGFWNATPAVQPTAVADATNGTDVITQLNALLSRMRTIGLIAT